MPVVITTFDCTLQCKFLQKFRYISRVQPNNAMTTDIVRPDHRHHRCSTKPDKKRIGQNVPEWSIRSGHDFDLCLSGEAHPVLGCQKL